MCCNFFSLICAVLVLVSCGYSQANSGVAFYVATDGNDSNPGTVDRPFATLEHARDQVRMTRDVNSGPVHVYLRSGTYYLNHTFVISERDSGSESQPILYSAYNDEDVTLSGGVKLTGTWRHYQNVIMVCDLNEKGLACDELFMNGKRQLRSRFPNFQLKAGFDRGYTNGMSPVAGWPEVRELSFDLKKFTRREWRRPEEAVLHIFGRSRWGNLQWRLKDVDRQQKMITLGEGGWQQNGVFQSNSSISPVNQSKCFIDNVFEELDAPGEWHLDHKNSKLYFIPPAGVDVEKATFVASQLETLISLKGYRAKPVRYIGFRGICFTHTRPVYLESYETPSLGDWAIRRSGAFHFDGTEDCVVEFCDFDAVGGNGVFISNHARRIRIYGNRFSASGESAICLAGKSHLNPNKSYTCQVCSAKQWWGWDEPTNEYPENCLISNNLIYDLGYYGKQTAGVFLAISKRNTVSHNKIYNTPRAAICINDGLHGGHIIEFNDIFKTVNETGDHGPFNSWGRETAWCWYQSHPTMDVPEGFEPPDVHPQHAAGNYLADARLTTHVRNNRFRDNNGWGIDLDDGTSNYHVYNNLCIGISVKYREGVERHVYNNIIINPVTSPCHHRGYIGNNDSFTLNIVVTNTAIDLPQEDIDFSMGKSEGASFMFGNPPLEKPWLSELDYNLYYNNIGKFIGRVSRYGIHKNMKRVTKEYTMDEWRKLGFDRNSVFADPLFVNSATGDFRLRESSPALNLGIKNLSLDEVGLRRDFPAKFFPEQ